MNRWIANAKVAMLAMFLVLSVAAFGYEWWYVWPVQKCDQRGGWWDPKDRQCLDPMPIWRITGRLPTPGKP
jgi:hypothetical protein